jgi:hypothetical protein
LAHHSHRWQKVQTLSGTSPLEVVARSKAVAEPSPWDRSSTIVARKPPSTGFVDRQRFPQEAFRSRSLSSFSDHLLMRKYLPT